LRRRFEPLPQVTKNVRYRNGKPHEHACGPEGQRVGHSRAGIAEIDRGALRSPVIRWQHC
jgi:hypothetical protein